MSDYDRTELAQKLFEESPDALFLFDPTTDRVVDANPAALRLCGFSLEELRQMEATTLFRFEGQESGTRLRRASRQTEIFHSQEGFLLRTRQDQVWVPVNLTITRLHVKPRTLGMLALRDLRDQRRAHQRLQAMEAELRRVLASVSDCLWSAAVDSTGQWSYRYYSPVVEKITGRPPDYFISSPKQWGSIIHPEDRPRWEKVFRRVKELAAHQEEYRILLPDGSVRWVRDSVNVTRDPHGKAIRLDGVISDITSRVQAEEDLARERFLLDALMDTVPDSIYFKDRESRFIRINQGMARWVGLTDPSKALGKTDFDLFTEEHARQAYEDEQEILRTGQPIQDKEEKETWPDGRETWVTTTKLPLRDREGNIIGTFGLSRDITRRKLAERRLSESERRYRQVTEASLDAIIVADAGQHITLFNPAAERLFGYQAAEVLGQPLSVLLPPEFQEKHLKGGLSSSGSSAAKVIARTVEIRGRRKDGAEFPVEFSMNVMELRGERQYLVSIRDLTERNRLRAAMVQSEKLASIGLLSAGIAHEINNPMAYVSNNLVVLERDTTGLLEILKVYESTHDRLAQVDPAALEQVQALAEKIDLDYVRGNLSRLLAQTREGARRVTRIVQSMRGLARSGPPELETARLPDLFDASLDMIRGRLHRAGIQVATTYEVVEARCVAHQLSQVFLNLLVNALQAIQTKGQPQGGEIRIATRAANDEVLIEVADNGCGIRPEHLAHLFDPFFTTKPVGEGTGLGLWISHNIVTGHGGRLEADSRVGEGSVFRIFLPRDGRAE